MVPDKTNPGFPIAPLSSQRILFAINLHTIQFHNLLVDFILLPGRTSCRLFLASVWLLVAGWHIAPWTENHYSPINLWSFKTSIRSSKRHFETKIIQVSMGLPRSQGRRRWKANHSHLLRPHQTIQATIAPKANGRGSKYRALAKAKNLN